jgi:hypothetical protein
MIIYFKMFELSARILRRHTILYRNSIFLFNKHVIDQCPGSWKTLADEHDMLLRACDGLPRCCQTLFWSELYCPFTGWKSLAGMRDGGWRHAVRQKKREKLIRHLVQLSILKKLPHNNFMRQVVVTCVSSDLSVRLESESLWHPHPLDACAAIVIWSKR